MSIPSQFSFRCRRKGMSSSRVDRVKTPHNQPAEDQLEYTLSFMSHRSLNKPASPPLPPDRVAR